METSQMSASVPMSMSVAPTGTMSGMSMASSTTSTMSTSSGTMMNMASMSMTFFFSSITPLYSMRWTPSTVAQYAGTCIFLIAFAAVFRALLAVRFRFFPLLAAFDAKRNGGLVYEPYQHEKPAQHRWRAREATLLSLTDVVLAGVGMIAVMTMNVGYFLSVLAGIFIGSMMFGRFIATSSAH